MAEVVYNPVVNCPIRRSSSLLIGSNVLPIQQRERRRPTQAKFSLCPILGRWLTLHETIYCNKKQSLNWLMESSDRNIHKTKMPLPWSTVLLFWSRGGVPVRLAVPWTWCRGALCAGTPECGPARYVRLRPIYWHQGGPRTQRPLHQRNRVDLQRRQWVWLQGHC